MITTPFTEVFTRNVAMQYSLFDTNQEYTRIPLPLPDGDVYYYPRWLNESVACTYYDELAKTLPWRQDHITLYGKQVAIPRLQSWHGDPECEYTYSNLTMTPQPWSEVLSKLKHGCETITKAKFNCVLANWYRDGQDGMGLHADDEPELGTRPVIASVSLGQIRRFTFKHKTTKASYHFDLEPGSLLVMAGDTQRYYFHGLSKTKKPIGGRINLTFRLIRPNLVL